MTTKIKGIHINLGGRDLVVPPLNFKALQDLQERLASFTGDTSPESIQLVLDAAHAALSRNYNDVTKEFLAEYLDLENMADVMRAVMDVSGLQRKSIESSSTAEGAQNPSTGPSSTPT